jgi:DNA-binding transcriptional MerR regulator
MSRTYQVKDVARLAGVSVRTLHYYDELGLLVPSERTAAGYRLYTDADLLRLQQILIQRELGLPLEEIRRALDDPDYDRRAALVRQREELARRADRMQQIIRALDRALAMEDPMTTEMKSLFDGFDPAQYEAEARDRWGDTDAYRVSRERTRRYTKADWTAIRDEQTAIYADAAAALAAGKAPTDADVLAIAERHRRAIDRWFYPCSAAMHAGLADMWEADPRFRENIDKHGAGLTAFLAAAVRANARRAP